MTPRNVTARNVFLAAVCALALAVAIHPHFDLSFSRLFYIGPSDFLLRGRPLGRFFNDLVRDSTVVLAIGLLAGFAVAIAFKRKVLWLSATQYLFLILCLAIGPGLVANGILKEHWGRARPRNVAEFGGHRQFTPALQPADQCAHNCSFVSGDASQGFFYTAFAFVVPRRRRKPVMAAGLAIGALVGLERIMQGAHFLSDVLFAGIVTVAVIYAMRWLVLDGGWRRLVPRPS